MKIRQVFDFETLAGELAHGLRHQARLHAHVAVAHFAVEFGFGNQRGHRIHHQHVDGAGGDQRAGDFERLLGVVGLRDQQIVDIHAELAGVDGIERVLHVDEGRHAAGLLRFGDHLQRDRGFAGRFRAENFDDAAARKSAHAQRVVERNGAGRNRRHRHDGFLRPQPHNGAFAELLFNLAERESEGACAFFFVHA